MKNQAETTEGKLEGQPAEAAKPAKPKKEKNQPGGMRLPFLLELTYTVSTLILVFLALAIIITSFLAGASLFVIVLRTSVAVMLVGALLMLISSQISSGLLFAVKAEQEEAERKLNEVPGHVGNVTVSGGEGSLAQKARDTSGAVAPFPRPDAHSGE